MAVEFYIQIESPTGAILGAGPIVSASGWNSTSRMDQSGDFSFTIPASDPKAALIVEKRRVRAFNIRQGVWTEEGDGIIDQIDTTVADDGTIELAVSGQDGAYELDGFLVPHTISMAIGSIPQLPTYVLGLLESWSSTCAIPAVWTFNKADSGSTSLYGAFYDESVLHAIIVVAQKAGCHWRYDGSRTITFFTGFTSSGVRAIRQNLRLSAETCAITDIKKTVDTHELATAIYAYGSGQSNSRFTFAATNRSVPAGYNSIPTASFLSNNDALANYGLIHRTIDFKDIVPILNTDADIQAAANALFDAGYLYLKRYSQRAITYDLSVEGCRVRLRPGQTIRVDYHAPEAGLDINQDLYIIEATTAIGDDGVNTTNLTVSTLDAWPTSDVDLLVNRLIEGKIYQAYPQLNANSYTTGYTENLDDTVTASFPFDFGNEVTQISSVILKFQLLPFESTVKTIALESMTGGSGQLLTDGATGNTGNPSNNVSGGPSNNASSTPSVNESGAPSNNVSGGASGGTAGSSGGSGGPSNNVSGGGSGGTDPSSVDSGPSSGGSGGPSTGSGGPSNNSTGGPSGGDTEPGGGHYHALNIIRASIGGGWTPVYIDPLSEQLYTSGAGSSLEPETQVRGDHDHSLNSHTHSLNSHTHSLNGHTHSLNSHTHSLNSHTHSLNAHTHDLSGHTHDLNSHTHGLNGHTHDLNGHTHSLNSHTHDLNNHTHSLNNHTHTMTPTITTLYGIFREDVVNTYDVGDLEYRVNSGSWTPTYLSTSLGDGWYQIDITSYVYDPVSFRPLQESNVLQIRRAAASIMGRTVTIKVLLSVRNIIQSIVLS